VYAQDTHLHTNTQQTHLRPAITQRTSLFVDSVVREEKRDNNKVYLLLQLFICTLYKQYSWEEENNSQPYQLHKTDFSVFTPNFGYILVYINMANICYYIYHCACFAVYTCLLFSSCFCVFVIFPHYNHSSVL